MKNAIVSVVAPVALAAMLAAPAHAKVRSMSGSYNGMEWTAQSMLTGVTSTGDSSNTAGDPLYWPVYPRDSGIVQLLMDYGPGGAFICSGTLLNDRQSILTAAHCVSDGAGTPNPLTTYVMFQPPSGVAPGTRIFSNVPPVVQPGVTTITVSGYTVHPLYTGQVIDQNDIAVLRLSSPAPDHAASYGLYTASDLEGQNFTVAGYGNLGAGATGTSGFTARLRNGDNRYDFALGNPIFGTNWSTVLGVPFSQLQYSIVSDFDNGLAANDTACLTAQASNIAGAAGAVFCNTGLGAREVGVAGGDSGGPNFIGGLLSGVNSYGLSFGPSFGDALSGLNSSFGEFSGYVPVNIHADFINAALVPEPGTYAMMFAGLAAIGLMARRRKV